MPYEQEMQFADPDWKPTGPLSAQPTGPLVTQLTNTGANASTSVSANGPGNGQVYDASQVASLPTHGQGYQGPWQSQPPSQNPLQPLPSQQTAAQQATRQRGHRRVGWWVGVIIFIICISLGSGIFRSTSHNYPDNKNFGPQQGVPVPGKQAYDLNGAIQLNINDLSGDITVQVDRNSDQRVIVSTGNGSQTDVYHQGQNMVLTAVNNGSIKVIIPPNVALHLSGGTNSIEVDGFSGQLIAQTNSGQITLDEDNLNQDSSLDTNSGNISLEQQSTVSDTTITSLSGAITLDQTNLSGQVTLSTGGNSTIGYSGTLDPQGKYQFTTDSGNIDLTVPQTTAMKIKLSQKGGSYTSAFPKTTGSSPQASVGLTTNSGNIAISQQ